MQNQSADRKRNEKFVKEFHVINRRRFARTRFIMREPCIRKICSRVRMTFPACCNKVRFQHRRILIFDGCNIVDAVAICAYRFPSIGRFSLGPMEGCTHSVKVLQIGLDHLRGQSILLHQYFVGMTLSAELGRAKQETICARVFNIMSLMAIHANRYVDVSAIHKRFAVNALDIGLINLLMAPFASL